MLIRLVLTLLFSSSCFAQMPLSEPEGEVILEVFGNIEVVNEEDYAIFDRAMIEAMPQFEIKTNNHVIDDITRYTGPKLIDLITSLGGKGSVVNITAWDDYVVQIPIETIEKYGVILATHENGRKMTLEDRGPFFVIFPFSDNEEIQRDHYYNMSIWQIRSLEIK